MNHWEKSLSGSLPVANGFTSELERKVRERVAMEKKKSRKAWLRVLPLAAAAVLVVGLWRFGDVRQPLQADGIGALSDDAFADKEFTLKVYGGSSMNVDTLKRQFIIRHPSVDISMSGLWDGKSRSLADYRSALDRGEDVLVVPTAIYRQLAAEGRILPLEPYLLKDKLDLSDMHAPVLDALKAVGGGELQGLAGEFSSRVLFVNPDLFAKNGVALPREGATVQEILETAKRFEGTGTTGLATDTRDNGNPAETALKLGQASGLQLYGGDPMLQSSYSALSGKGWIKLFDQVAAGFREGWIAPSPDLDFGGRKGIPMSEVVQNDLFGGGKAAMRFGDTSFYSQLASTEIERPSVAGVKSEAVKRNWKTLPYEQNIDSVNASDLLDMSRIYVINAKSVNKDAAWELVKAAVLMSKTERNADNSMDMPVFEEAMKSQQEERWKAFYTESGSKKLNENSLPVYDGDSYLGYLSIEYGPQMKQWSQGKLSSEEALRLIENVLARNLIALERNLIKEGIVRGED
ncbi:MULTISPECIES: extracellular solute-binding protein [unclassified Paenibacillus]|uniref:ABC transporter substrate-binding protein n=1 Tax=unclassified Paenibacillus TaxID=185978 RepID=UPI000955F1F0|nr:MULTISPECIES: extracellular solute-binding protein [unclassified Paenibacillus]ASS65618.1 extracellular solute-binding protein [Paenibacillus sp. RUD330]SIQ29571.1 multiple sugar transport system substrate-binding protein [Paenibacillus sp. RU4X]SIQ51602.1 multiple sugar transport system substrate-binding protein [Paenibacillus sp. RU4T]